MAVGSLLPNRVMPIAVITPHSMLILTFDLEKHWGVIVHFGLVPSFVCSSVVGGKHPHVTIVAFSLYPQHDLELVLSKNGESETAQFQSDRTRADKDRRQRSDERTIVVAHRQGPAGNQ